MKDSNEYGSGSSFWLCIAVLVGIWFFTWYAFGCAPAKQESIERLQTQFIQVEFEHAARLKVLEDTTLQLDYYVQHDKCFNSYAVCLAEGKGKSKCWKMHEDCVVSVFKNWQKVKKNRGMK